MNKRGIKFNGIKFVRIVKDPVVDGRDLSNQLAQSNSFRHVHAAIVREWNRSEGCANAGVVLETEIDVTLDIIKAEFSAYDESKILPMWDEMDPEDIAHDVRCGIPCDPGEPVSTAAMHENPDMKFEIRPRLMPLREMHIRLMVAKKNGHVFGITFEQLWRAHAALEAEHTDLMSGKKNFDDYSLPASMVLTGAQLCAAAKDRPTAVLLNVLFAKTPGVYKRLARLSQAKI